MNLYLKYIQLNTILLITGLVVIFSSCKDSNSIDNTPPTISFTSFFEESVSDTISISFMANDDYGIDKVDLWVDGIESGLSDSTEPFLIDFDTKSVVNGNYILVGRAFNLKGIYADSEPQILTVYNDDDIPTISLTIPSLVDSISTLSDTVAVIVEASDESGIDFISLFIDDSLTELSYNQSIENPFLFEYLFPTGNYSNGLHNLQALASDFSGNVAYSNINSVNIYNSPRLLLESDKTNLNSGDSLKISIIAENFPPIFAMTLSIIYNDSLLSFDETLGYNSGTFFGGNNISFSSTTSSDIYLTNSLTQGQEEVSGFGTIGLLNFSSISAGQDTIHINEFSFFNSDGIEIFVDDLDSGFLPFIIQ